MRRALLLLAAGCLLCASTAAADTVGDNVKRLGSGSHKVRLAAVLALSRSSDARATIALADALGRDDEADIRRVAALALEKTVDEHTPDDAKSLAIEAVDIAARSDRDPEVRSTAAKALKVLGPLRKVKQTAKGPEVFVDIDATVDQSKKAPGDAPARLTSVVKKNIEKTGYATSWPGGLPTSSQLTSSRSRAFIVASTVKKIDITHSGGRTTIACTVAIRVAPWSGKDGGEKWEASKAASASGSAKATTGNTEREVSSGVRDCLEAVGEDVTARQVVPFLRRIAQAGS